MLDTAAHTPLASAAQRSSPTAPARSIGRPSARCWSRTCIWRRARPTRETRHAAAALRHARDAGAAGGRDRALRARAGSSRWATAFTTRRRRPHRRATISRACRRCSGAASGSGSPATTTPRSPRAPAGVSPTSSRSPGSPCATRRRPAAATHEIAGHLHPAAKLSMYGTTIRRPCFVGNGRRLVMPAFGAFTGGLNVLDAAFPPLFRRRRHRRVDAGPRPALPRRDAGAERGLRRTS